MFALLVVGSALGAPQAPLKTTARLPRTVLKSAEPVHVYFAMENRAGRTLSFEKHSRGPCFLAKFVSVKLSPPAPLKELPDCTTPVENVKDGEVVEFLVDLREAFELEERDYSIRVEWRDGGPETYSKPTSLVGQVTFKVPFYEDRMVKGAQIFLPDKNTLVFRGHKTLPPPRKGESPLVVMDFLHQIRGEGEVDVTVPVQLDDTRQFDAAGYRFDVVHHQFDQWMQVRIYE